MRTKARNTAESGDAPVFRAFWSALDLLRPLVLVYVVGLYVHRLEQVAHPERGWVILGVLAAWTMAALLVRRRTPAWLAVELALGAGAILASGLVDSREVIEAGAPTVPGMWPATTVLSWAVLAGPLGGAAAATVVVLADLVLVRVPTTVTFHNIVILLLLGTLVGYCAEFVGVAHRAAREAEAIRARAAARERLARDVHDGVLQALSLVHRRGLEIGGETAELGRLAGEQERHLRKLIRLPVLAEGSRPVPAPGVGVARRVDLAALLRAWATERVSVVDTGPVLLAEPRAREIDAAVAAALDNVARHAGEGARAWVLLEEVGGEVVVTVRDDGVGMDPGRLDRARAEGRLGVAASIVGRARELGGDASITPGPRGTVAELRVPCDPTHGTGREGAP
ncbi:MacS family sensor histidine kinase [Mobilicoccus pelagius]|uniref:Putative two-component histidine kinase n=1 Tax=Mobilicoccus pelagius NBRC 104925 TaxID=1089455 RepID=H5UUS3_9MICO|nr:DUF5931 domain-containing protein [Mobilicoccus pelagius]GAB49481.1 putative two-component histidine kinase [Mobilicoccus pelagius NBRC 104925]